MTANRYGSKNFDKFVAGLIDMKTQLDILLQISDNINPNQKLGVHAVEGEPNFKIVTEFARFQTLYFGTKDHFLALYWDWNKP